MLVQDKLQSGEHFTEVDRRIADYLLARGEGLRGETVRQIAARLYVAPSSVMRLAQKLGYDGFNALRDDYLKEIEYLSSHFRQLDPNYPFAKGDAEGVMIGKMLALHQEILADCRSLLTPAALRQAVDLLARARRICLFGTGTHMGVAADFVEKMAKIGREVCPISQTDLALWKALASGGDTCFILFSYTGETTAALSLARQLKLAGCEDRRELPFHKMLLAGELPLTMGGGIGQSRVSMLLLGKAHIGEVQSSLWDEENAEACEKAGIALL